VLKHHISFCYKNTILAADLPVLLISPPSETVVVTVTTGGRPNVACARAFYTVSCEGEQFNSHAGYPMLVQAAPRAAHARGVRRLVQCAALSR
jgi:hypothetical protein